MVWNTNPCPSPTLYTVVVINTRYQQCACTSKQLEESVQVLQAQLEEARRQLSNAAYGGGRIGYSPEPKNVGQMAQENAYLRDENADLRRQLYALRAGGPYPDPSGRPPVPLGSEPMSDVKTESATPTYGVYPAGTVVSPPRMPSSSHGRTMSHPGDFVRVSCVLCRLHALPHKTLALKRAADMAGPRRRVGQRLEHVLVPPSPVPVWHHRRRGEGLGTTEHLASPAACLEHELVA